MHTTYFEGRWTDGNVPLIGSMDHSVWLASTVFDGARSIHRMAPDLRAHCERTYDSARRMGLSLDLPVDELERLCIEGIHRFPEDVDLYIRPLVFGTEGLLVPEKSAFALSLFEAPLPPFTGFSAHLSRRRRPSPLAATTDAKASALYPNVARALREAAAAGFSNAVILDPDGNVAEFATANLFFVAADGAVVTPAANGTFLAGITRSRVIGLLADAGIVVEQRTVEPQELESAREIFNTGNYGKVMPCTRYNARELPIGPVATRARDLYMAFAATCRV
ncbi:MAG TPA: branched-chain amino acid aminotransferase [Burkholderiaceae bacterium]|nr:branched-chain amino acid aminotransferase [Burkholderiaceae bacterium]HQR69535.1 branched-chain amino acid aminotransferase [Burkholderiaceae bacterium]